VRREGCRQRGKGRGVGKNKNSAQRGRKGAGGGADTPSISQVEKKGNLNGGNGNDRSVCKQADGKHKKKQKEFVISRFYMFKEGRKLWKKGASLKMEK